MDLFETENNNPHEISRESCAESNSVCLRIKTFFQRQLFSIALIFLFIALQVVFSPNLVRPVDAATAKTTSTTSPGAKKERQAREDVRKKKAAVAAEIDVLNASDDDLEAALSTLEANLLAEQAILNDINVEVNAAQQKLSELEQQITSTTSEATTLEQKVQEQAISSYINPGGPGNTSDYLFGDSDMQTAKRKKLFVDTVTGNEADALDRLRLIRKTLERQQRDAQVIKNELDQKKIAAQQQVDAVAVATEQQRKLKIALDARIAEFRQEVDELATAEASLSGIIKKNEDEQRAREEAARKAAQAAGASSIAPSVGGGGTPTSASGLIWPTQGSFTSGFGPRWGRMHQGIDVANSIGTPVNAAKGGTVIFAGQQSGYGNVVIIDHGGGFSTVYAHLNSIKVSAGQSVSQGQSIATMGNTGRSTGPHLHFETRINGAAQNPRRFL